MRFSRRNRSIATYLACMAMALQALWPLIAQAKPRSVTLVPVCTVQGVTHYLELPTGNSPLEQKSSSQHEHCSYCSFGGERVVVPPSFSLLPAPRATCVAAVGELPSFSEAQSRFFARPRAPPAIP